MQHRGGGGEKKKEKKKGGRLRVDAIPSSSMHLHIWLARLAATVTVIGRRLRASDVRESLYSKAESFFTQAMTCSTGS